MKTKSYIFSKPTNGFRNAPKQTIKQLKKHQELYKQSLKGSIGKEYILLAEGITSNIMKVMTDFLKLDFDCIPKYKSIFKTILTYCDKLLESTRNELETIPLEYAAGLTKDKLKEYSLKAIEEGKKNKYKASEIGILERDFMFFQIIDISYDIINNELLKDSRFNKEQIKNLKYTRTYCSKLVEFFNNEVLSDLENRGLFA